VRMSLVRVMRNPLFAPSAALLISVCTLYVVSPPEIPPLLDDVSIDLRDAVNNMPTEDLATIHEGLVEEGKDSCRLCHTVTRRSASKPLWADPASWIASNAPAAAMTEGNLRSSDLCLSCHDGVSMGGNRSYRLENAPHQSRRKFDLKNGHPIGIEYRGNNPDVQLDNGKIACITCHTAHNDMGANTRSSKCTDCHSGM